MCGIAGYSSLSGSSFYKSWLDQARSRLSHRGPDGYGLFFDDVNGIGLSHTRLAILDTSSFGSQPMHSCDGRWHLVFNGEIYNYRELRQELVSDGITFRGESDTEVLLALWQQRGPDCLPQLKGMFAFAIWDSLECDLFLVRDPYGVKPLFYVQLPQGLFFASEAKALVPLLSSPSGLDPDSLLRQLSYLWCPGPGTLHPSVTSLEPGCLLYSKLDNSFVINRWSVSIPPLYNQILQADSATQATLSLFRKSVHRQMVADVPLGSFLSGGLDSSAVVAMAREFNPDLECFTAVNPGGPDSGFAEDLPYARHVARHLGVTLHEVRFVPPIRYRSPLDVAQLDARS